MISRFFSLFLLLACILVAEFSVAQESKEHKQKLRSEELVENIQERVESDSTSSIEILDSRPGRDQAETEAQEQNRQVESGNAPEPERSNEAKKTSRKANVRSMVDSQGSLLSDENANTPGVTSLPLKKNQSTTNQQDNKDFVPAEILLVSKDMAMAKVHARQLSFYKLRIKSRQRYDALGFVLSVFRIPNSADTLKVLAKIQAKFPELTTDTNQRYQLLSDPRNFAKPLVNWPPTQSLTCLDNRTIRIGMIDTTVNTDHPLLLTSAIETRSFAKGGEPLAVHGTAIASLLTGKMGLLPNVQLFAANVFYLRGERTETTVKALIDAMNWLLDKNLSAINLSLGGARNRIFDLALTKAIEKKIWVAAAAGNSGPEAPPVYPASKEGVIAVTAVDASKRLYRQANSGSYIDFAAPGVDVWAANAKQGGHYHTGTSFAVPFVTAVLALTSETGFATLQSSALDLGSTGKDEQFGWGLIKGPQHPCPEK